MGYVSTGMGESFGALLVSMMALQLMLVDQNPFGPCYHTIFVNISNVTVIFHEG